MNIRLVVSRLAVFAVVLVALVSQHAWAERGLADTFLASLGFVLLLTGCIGRIWCAVYISGRKDVDLVVDGPFSIMRNPLYFFSFLALIGAGLSFESLTLAAAFGTIFFVTHWRTMRLEERKLSTLFGDQYVAYLARVPRFLPNPKLYVPAKQLTLSAPTFTRAMMEAALIPLAFQGAAMVEVAHEFKVLPTLLWLY